MTTITQALDLLPLDVLFFRDGRAFTPGGRVASALPTPQTLAGALRSHLMARMGCDFDALSQATLAGESLETALGDQHPDLAPIARLALKGPWLADETTVFVAAPLTLRRRKGGDEIFRLDPLAGDLPGWDTASRPPGCEDSLTPLWLRTPHRTEKLGGFISLDGLRAFLNGGVPAPTQLREPGQLFVVESRTGIGLKPGGSSVEPGLIYEAGFLRLRPGVRFRCEIRGLTPGLRDALLDDPSLSWGGEGRHVRLAPRASEPPWPDVGPASSGHGRCLLLTQPAFLDGGWKEASWQPLAAAVGPGQPISGWDLARRGPKPTRFAVPAGSVFFFRDDASLPGHGGLGAREDVALGYGSTLKGNWTHA